MKNIILNFLRPYVLSILKDSLKVESNKNGLITGVKIAGEPPTGIPPIIPAK